VVVPAVAVVIVDHHRRALPAGELLQLVDGVGEEGLLVERVGVTGVTVLILGGLQIRHRGQVAMVGGGEEVLQVVLVVGLVLLAHGCHRGRREMLGVRRRGVVLERLVVGAVILDRMAEDVVVGARADG
jgi:hypothetical protein